MAPCQRSLKSFLKEGGVGIHESVHFTLLGTKWKVIVYL